jgi:hypothetical protein
VQEGLEQHDRRAQGGKDQPDGDGPRPAALEPPNDHAPKEQLPDAQPFGEGDGQRVTDQTYRAEQYTWARKNDTRVPAASARVAPAEISGVAAVTPR